MWAVEQYAGHSPAVGRMSCPHQQVRTALTRLAFLDAFKDLADSLPSAAEAVCDFFVCHAQFAPLGDLGVTRLHSFAVPREC